MPQKRSGKRAVSGRHVRLANGRLAHNHVILETSSRAKRVETVHPGTNASLAANAVTVLSAAREKSAVENPAAARAIRARRTRVRVSRATRILAISKSPRRRAQPDHSARQSPTAGRMSRRRGKNASQHRSGKASRNRSRPGEPDLPRTYRPSCANRRGL